MTNANKTLSFEEALTELEDIVKKMEGGNLPLSSSVELYERGAMLKKICEKHLNEATLKIEKISVCEDGSEQSESVDPDTFTSKQKMATDLS